MKSELTQPELGIALTLGNDAAAFHIHRVWRVTGPLDLVRLHDAVVRLVDATPAFHRALANEDGRPTWRTAPAIPDWRVVDSAEKLGGAEARRPFALHESTAPRVRVLRIADNEHLLSLTVHHLVCDGWSLELLVERLGEAYDGDPRPVPAPTVTHVDPGSAYWDELLEGAGWPDLFGRTEPAEPPNGLSEAGQVTFHLPEGDRIITRAREAGLSPLVLSLAALNATLRRYGSAGDAVIGTPMSRRDVDTFEDVGCLARMALLRPMAGPDPTLAEVATAVHRALSDAFVHQHEWSPLAADFFVPEAVGGRRVSLQLHEPPKVLRLGEAVGVPERQGTGLTRFDLEIDMYRDAEGSIDGRITFAHRHFAREWVDGFAGGFRTVLAHYAQDWQKRISTIDLHPPSSRTAPVKPVSLPDSVHTWALHAPDRPAIADGEGTVLTFGELDAAADRLAARLRTLGTGAVAVLADRGPELIIAVLGVMRSGSVLVPLDQSWPQQRRDHILRVTGALGVVCSPGLRALVAEAALPCIDPVGEQAPPESVRRVSDAGHDIDTAYILFTSGTTGRPKGVVISRPALDHHLGAYLRTIHGSAPDGRRVAVTSGAVFDAFWDQAGLLARGDCLVVAPEDVRRDPQRLCRWIRRTRIDVLNLTPSVIEAARGFGFSEVVGAQVSLLIVGGEAISPALWRFLRGLSTTCVNLYGPTECTVDITYAWLHDHPSPTLGRPLPGVEVHVLNEDLAPVPPGGVGIVYVAGPRLATGYLAEPEETATAFLERPRRMYRTGDLVGRGPDGLLYFLRRADGVLKVNGQRVDPVEIEQALRAMPEIVQAHVPRAHTTPDVLRAFVAVRDGAAVDAHVLRRRLGRLVAPASVPGQITLVTRWPLDVTGKCDERALLSLAEPVPTGLDYEPSDPATAPFVAAWIQVVGAPPASRDTNFFRAGGSSLAAARLIASLRQSAALGIDLADFYARPTLRALLDTTPLEPVRTGRPRILSHAQRRLWLLDRLKQGTADYVLPFAWRVHGASDELQRALHLVLSAHEVLRMTFDFPGLRVADALPPPAVVEAVGDDEAEKALAADIAAGFDLESGPLVRATIYRLSDDEHLVTVVAHHSVLDGRSVAILRAEFDQALGSPGWSPPDRPSYFDFAALEADGGWRRDLGAWRRELGPTPAPLPWDSGEGAEAAIVRVAVPRDVWRRLCRSAAEGGRTPYQLALAAFAMTLHAWTDCPDELIIGTSMDARPPGFDDTVGLFVNPVPVHVAMQPSDLVSELVERVSRTIRRAHRIRNVPYDEIARACSASGRPLIQVLFDQAEAAEIGIDPPAPKYEMSATLIPAGEHATVRIAYRRPALPHADAFAEALVKAFAWVSSDRPATVDTFTVAPAAPADSGGVPPEAVHIAFRRWVRRTPDALALRSGDTRLTYRELDQRAQDVAGWLRERRIGLGDRVAVCMERGAAQVAVVLGVVMSGASLVPLDPSAPAPRRAATEADAGVRLTLSSEPSPPARPQGAVTDRYDEAYVVYTSGSTGRPKGVVVSHEALARSTAARSAVYHERPVFLWVSPLSFDSAMAGLWGTLTSGGCLVVPDDRQVRSPEALIGLVQEHQVTATLMVPGLWDLVLRSAEPSRLASLRQVAVAGDVLPAGLITRHFDALPRCQVINEYGPTEGTVWATYAVFDGSDAPITIGRTVSGVSAHVLDRWMRPVPVCVPGELAIAGPQLAWGYHGDASATATRFVPDPWSEPGARLYLTGDRVWRTEQGDLRFVGRRDNQLKLRGYRIDPGEIEQVLTSLPGVTAAIVVPVRRPDGTVRQLTAYLTTTDGHGPAPGRLEESLPAHLVPARLVTVPDLPTTGNGKVDRAALEEAAARVQKMPTASASLREQVRAAWYEVLGERVEDDVNFFDAGGHSLLAVDLQAAIRRCTGREVTLVDVFARPTVGALADHLAARHTDGEPGGVEDRAGGSRLRALARRRRGQKGS